MRATDPRLSDARTFTSHSGMQGPREDTGFINDVNPGVRMAARIYNYCAKYHSKTKVMVSGIRKAQGASWHWLPSLCTSQPLARQR